MRRLVVEVVAGRDRVAGHRRVGMEKGKCDRKDLVVEAGAEGAWLVGNWRKAVGMGVWMLEVAEQDHSGRSGSCQDLMVVDQAVSVAKRHRDSDGRECVCLAPRGKAAEDFLDMARDEELASRFAVYHGPSMMFDRAIHDDTKGVHSCQTYPATQRKGVVDRNQEPTRACHHLSGMQTNETCLWDRPCHVLPPYGRAVPLSCATCLVDLFGVRTRQLPSVAVYSIGVERSAAAMALELVALAMMVRWLEG